MRKTEGSAGSRESVAWKVGVGHRWLEEAALPSMTPPLWKDFHWSVREGKTMMVERRLKPHLHLVGTRSFRGHSNVSLKQVVCRERKHLDIV